MDASAVAAFSLPAGCWPRGPQRSSLAAAASREIPPRLPPQADPRPRRPHGGFRLPRPQLPPPPPPQRRSQGLPMRRQASRTQPRRTNQPQPRPHSLPRPRLLHHPPHRNPRLRPVRLSEHVRPRSPLPRHHRQAKTAPPRPHIPTRPSMAAHCGSGRRVKTRASTPASITSTTGKSSTRPSPSRTPISRHETCSRWMAWLGTSR